MEKANSLSRRPDQKVGVERDNENETLVKPEWLEVRRIEIVEIDKEWREVDSVMYKEEKVL